MDFIKSKKNNSGQAMIISVIFFLFISFAITVGLVGSTVREYKIVSGDLLGSKTSFFISESGVEDAYYRIKNGMNIDSVEVITLGDFSVTTTISDLSSIEKEIESIGLSNGRVRKNKAILVSGVAPDLSYAAHVGERGIQLESSSLSASEIIGDVYSNGPIKSTDNIFYHPEIRGNVVAAGPSGFLDGVHVYGGDNAYSYSASNIDVNDGGDYYCGLSNETLCKADGGFVSGDVYLNSATQPLLDMPITDSDITNFELAAASGDIISSPCPYVITGNVIIGPAVIECDVEIDGATITLSGPVWVKGDIDFIDSSNVSISSALGDESTAIIADNPSDRITSSKISFLGSNGGSTLNYNFSGSGPSSFVFFVSMNEDSESVGVSPDLGWSGGKTSSLYYGPPTNKSADIAIELQGSVTGDVFLYSPHGLSYISDVIDITGVSAYELYLDNQASVTYDSGLSSVFFGSSTSGWNVSTWVEYVD